MDDGKLAWKLRHDGLDWDAVAHELQCLPVVARALAGEYEKRTDATSEAAQFSLFG